MPCRPPTTLLEALEPRLCFAVGPTVIDLLALYTPGAFLGRGGNNPSTGAPFIHQAIREAVNTANLALQNSLIPISLRLVHMRQAGSSGTGDLPFDHARLSHPSDGFFDEAQVLRNTYGADLVTLISDDDPVVHGIADLMVNLADPNNPNTIFSVVAETHLQAGQTTLAHEIGHNLGAGHERNNLINPAVGPFPYSYGYRFNVGPNAFHDIMSYDPGVEIPLFANPDVLFRGVQAGSPEGSADAADIAQTFGITASLVAGYRATVVNDNTGPTASLYDAGLIGNVLTFSVRYRDESGVDRATIDANDLRVMLPDGGLLRPALLGVDGTANAFQRIATYKVVLSSDRPPLNLLQFIVQAGQVKDVHGNSVATGALVGGKLSADSGAYYLTGARDLGALANPSQRFLSESVGYNDEDDFYSFTLAERSTVALTLRNLSNPADASFVRDINGNGNDNTSELIAFTSVSSETGDRSVSATLDPGTYYIRIYVDPSNPNATSYDLSIRTYTDLTPPTVAFLDAPDITSEVSDHIIAVTYSDDQEIDGFGAVGFGGLTLHADFTGGGFFETLIYPDDALNPDESNGAVRTLYYRIPARLNGLFTSADNGLYTLSIFQPTNPNIARARDAAFNAVPPATTVGSFRVAIGNTPPDTTAPKARLNSLAPFVAGTTSYEFAVTYADNRDLNTSTLSIGRPRVSGPNGFDQQPTITRISPAPQGGNSRTVTYRITAPGGIWDATDDGPYNFTLPSNQIFDAAGNHSGIFLGVKNSQIIHLTVNDKVTFFSPASPSGSIVIDGDENFVYFQTNDTLLQHVRRSDVVRLSLTAAGEADVLLRSGAFTGAFFAGAFVVQNAQLVLDADVRYASIEMAAPSSLIDLQTHSITIFNPAANQLSQVWQWIRDGKLISSSMPEGFRLAAITRADGSILVKVARLGDANLDGKVNGDDLKRTDKGFLTGGNTWQNGDFNDDGNVDIDDYAILDAAYLDEQSGPSPAPAGGALASPAFQSANLISDPAEDDDQPLFGGSANVLG